VPSASTLDLTTQGSSGTINGVLFQQAAQQPAGTGNIDSFVRLKAAGHGTIEQGYNTDARPLQFDEMKCANYTRSIQLSDLPVVEVNGVKYVQFLLDINQTGSTPLLSLDQLRIYLGNAGNLTGYDPNTKQLAGLNPIYDMDAGTDNTVLLNYNLNHGGSGIGDMYMLVPVSLFDGVSGNPYVYIYSRIGDTAAANSGFEEWAIVSQNKSTLSGTVYFDANANHFFDQGESGIGGVTITLTGTDNQGNAINLTTVTDSNGFYFFSGLNPGTYSVTKTPPSGYIDDAANIGNLGGTTFGLSQINAISLNTGQNAFNYNFGEVLTGS
jgi:hypothetical protein